MLCVLSLYAVSQSKMSAKQRFSVSEVLSQLFDSESDIEENVSETEDNVEDNFEAFSSDENETLSVDPPVVSQRPADTLPSKNGKSLWSLSPHERQVHLMLLMSLKWFQAPPDALSAMSET